MSKRNTNKIKSNPEKEFFSFGDKDKSSSKIIIPSKQQKASGQYFDADYYDNRGRFRRVYNAYNLQSSDKAVNTWDRIKIVGLSRKLFSTMGEVSSASKIKSSWVVTGGFDAVFNGNNKEWATQYAYPFLKQWFLTCTNKGIAFDFKTCLKIVSRMLDRDGEMGLQFTSTKNGWPLLNFIEANNIAQRNSFDSTVSGGKYDGYKIRDGVVYADNGRPVAYSLKGSDENTDTIVSATQLTLITDPDLYALDRGLPIIAAALSDGLNLQEIDFYLTAVIKQESMIRIVETNEAGRASDGDLSWNDLSNTTSNTNGNIVTVDNCVPVEFVSDGNRYLKANAGEKLESFNTNRPAAETQAFIKRIEKRLLQCVGIPHEVLLSPGDAGGAATRGVAEMVRKTILERQLVIEKYAKLAVVYAINTAMQNGIIPENFNDDFTDWSFTKGPQLVLDAGYERDADRKDLVIGAKSLDDITRKYGKSALQVREEINIEADDLLSRAVALNKKYPQFDVNRCLDVLSQRGANYLPAVTPETQPDTGTNN